MVISEHRGSSHLLFTAAAQFNQSVKRVVLKRMGKGAERAFTEVQIRITLHFDDAK